MIFMGMEDGFIKTKECLWKNERVPMGKRMHIAFGIDKNYVCPAGIAITSILLNHPEAHFVFHIFLDQVADADREKLLKTAQRFHQTIFIYCVNMEMLADVPTPIANISAAANIRFFMPMALSGIAEKFLYLDGDTLCTGNITGLFQLDLSGKVAVVIRDEESTAKKQADRLGLRAQQYFNSGVLLIHVAAWNELRLSDACIKLSTDPSRTFAYLDQDVLNVLLSDRVVYAANPYNYLYNTHSLPWAAEIPTDAALVHFTGSPKPWYLWAQGHSGAQTYMQYAQQSKWREVPLQQPRTAREKKRMAQYCLGKGDWLQGALWCTRYVAAKFSFKAT